MAVSTVDSHNAVSEIVFGCLTISLLLNKYNHVVELCRDGQRYAGETRECLGGGRRHAVKHAVFNLFRSVMLVIVNCRRGRDSV